MTVKLASFLRLSLTPCCWHPSDIFWLLCQLGLGSITVTILVTLILQTIMSVSNKQFTYEPENNKTNNMTCEPSQDSDQSGHSLSPISLHCPHEKSIGSLPIHKVYSKDSDQTGQMPRLIPSLRWAHNSWCWFSHAPAHNWASSWENLFLPYANNKGADQPAHLRSLIAPLLFAA